MSGCLEWQIYIHGAGYPKGMFPTVKKTAIEVPSSSHPWVKKGGDGWFLHRQSQDGEGLSGSTPSRHIQLGAERPALRCQGMVVVVTEMGSPCMGRLLSFMGTQGSPNSLAKSKNLTWFSHLSLETGKQRQTSEEPPSLHSGCSGLNPCAFYCSFFRRGDLVLGSSFWKQCIHLPLSPGFLREIVFLSEAIGCQIKVSVPGV